MSDNRTVELLCKMLEERGIEWKDGDAAYEIEWSTPDGRHCSAMYWKPTFIVLISGCTPEQVIAATLGNSEIVRCRDCRHFYEDRRDTSIGWVDVFVCDSEQWSTSSMMPSHKVEPDGFCAWAERKDVDE